MDKSVLFCYFLLKDDIIRTIIISMLNRVILGRENNFCVSQLFSLVTKWLTVYQVLKCRLECRPPQRK